MQRAIVYLEHCSGRLTCSSLSLISAARQIAKANNCSFLTAVLIGGEGCLVAASEAKAYGFDEIVWAEHRSFETCSVSHLAKLLSDICRNLEPVVFIASTSSKSKDIAPMVAYYLKAGQASDVIKVMDGGHFVRPMYAGEVLAEVEIVSRNKVLTIRTSAFPEAKPQAVKEGVTLREYVVSELDFDDPSKNRTFISSSNSSSGRPDLLDAKVVVSAGRAISSAENFQRYVLPLADVLGAALGASRAAVDLGYASNDWQVGQTGKIVAPELYFALGISGAVQHLAGMRNSKTIVAINKDPEAPIFEISDYALVADIYEVVPELVEKLETLKKRSLTHRKETEENE